MRAAPRPETQRKPMKITESEVAECVATLREALPNTRADAGAIASIWHSIMRDRFSQSDLEGGIRFLLTDWKTGFWPPPGTVLEYVERYQTWRDRHDYEIAEECRKCSKLGMVLSTYKEGDWIGCPCYVLCDCSWGKQKRRYLRGYEAPRRKKKRPDPVENVPF